MPATGPIINVTPAQTGQLQSIVNGAASGTSILLDDGTYNLNGSYLQFTKPNVTLRSKNGSRDLVILDGAYVTTELIQVLANDITIAGVTLRRAYNHPIHVMTSASSGNVLRTRIYDVRIVDPAEQAIKINGGGANAYPDQGEIACSHLELTAAGRAQVRNNCYTGGVDAHLGRDWVVRDNRIEGFWCAAGLSEHAIHFWRGARDTLVERNRLINNARGVGFGLGQADPGNRTYTDTPCTGATANVGHYRGVVRNNFIAASDPALFASQSGFDTGIGLAQSCGTEVKHNTVASTATPFSSIEWRFGLTSVTLTNNLVTHSLVPRDGAQATSAGNLASVSPGVFVSLASGDLHLKPAAAPINAGVGGSGVATDLDGDARDAMPDVGADEQR